MKQFAGLLVAALILAAQTPQDDFQQRVYPVLEAAQCRACHNDNGVASVTRLQFPPEGAPADDVRSFGLSLQRLIDRNTPDASLLLRKPTNRMPHTGGERIRQGSDGETLLRAWVNHLAKLPEVASTRTVGHKDERAVLRRLTHSQYNNTVADLLGDQTRPANQFPKEDFVHGFTNQVDGQSISPLLAEAYNRSAERLARNAAREGVLRRFGCAEMTCGETFVKTFGLKVFRRPLTGREVTRFRKLFETQTTFDAAAQLVVEAMLQSPAFLFQTETGNWATASRLAYFLWDTMPDDALLVEQLSTPAQIEAVARRMMTDERARRSMNEFLAQWIRFDRVRNAIRDRRLFPEYGPELIDAMLDETTQFFEHLVWKKRNFMEFLTADYRFANPSLAQVYGADGLDQRSGILGQATFLTLTSKPADTSPTERGLFIREHFLCQIVPPPPPGVDTNLPALMDEKPMTNRQRLAVHLSNEACSGCHRLVDSIGFGFERFDAIGRFSPQQVVTIHPTLDEITTKKKTKPTEHKLDLDTSASIRGIANSDFSTPREAGAILAKDPGCQKCIVKQLFRYALGRAETSADRPAIDKIFEAFERSQFRFQDLIIAIVTSGPFLEGGSHAN